MENLEKIKITNLAEYYTTAITLLRGEGGRLEFITTSEEISLVIDRLDKHLGITYKNKTSRAQAKFYKKNCLINLFKSNIIEEGKGKDKKYCFMFKAEDFVALDKKLMSRSYPMKRKIKVTSASVEDKTTETEKLPTTAEPVKVIKPGMILSGKRIPKKSFIKKMLKLAYHAYVGHGSVFTKDVYSIMGYKRSNSLTNLINSWKSTLIGGGIFLKVTRSASKRLPSLVFDNPLALLTDLKEKYKIWYAEEPPTYKIAVADPASGKTVEKTVTEPVSIGEDTEIVKPLREVDDKSFHKAYSVFAIGALCHKQMGTIEFANLHSALITHFKLDLDKTEILQVIKELASDKFCIHEHTGIHGISLKKLEDWDEIKEKFSPKNFKETCYMRLTGVGEDELEKILPSCKFEVASTISDYDKIYKVTYDRSMTTFMDLVSFRRSFRINDIILDEKLEKRLSSKIQKMIEKEIEIFRNGYAFKIEVEKK